MCDSQRVVDGMRARSRVTPASFDPQASHRARDEAISRCGQSSPNWLELAVAAIDGVALGAAQHTGGNPMGFTSDDVLKHEPRLERCPEKRVIGAAFNIARKQGIITPTGRYVASSRVASHGRPKREWAVAGSA